MSGFPLLELPQSLLEKSIAKIGLKGNFRLRRTCRDLRDLIQTRISVKVAGAHLLYYQNSSCGIRRCYEAGQIDRDINGCYGIRMEELSLPPKSDGRIYESLCQNLKKYRLTADKVRLMQKFSNEQCSTLLKLLKPIQVRYILHRGVSSLEPLLNFKKLRIVDLSVYLRDALPAMAKLLPRFPEVELAVIGGINNFPLFREALQLLFSSPWSRRKVFRLHLILDHYTTQEELNQNFPDYQWNSEQVDDEDGYIFPHLVMFSADVELPADFPPESSCKITAKPTFGTKHYTNLILCYTAENVTS